MLWLEYQESSSMEKDGCIPLIVDILPVGDMVKGAGGA